MAALIVFDILQVNTALEVTGFPTEATLLHAVTASHPAGPSMTTLIHNCQQDL